MKTKSFVTCAGVLLLGLTLLANPGNGTATPNCSDPQEVEKVQRSVQEELAKAQAEIARAMAELQQQLARESALRKEKLSAALAAQREALLANLRQQQAQLLAHKEELVKRAGEVAARAKELVQNTIEQEIWLSDSSAGWLGVSIAEVDAEKVKELKLPAERGVVVAEVEANSPAAKAGLKANDVILEFNGQRVESTAQFRRLVRETLPGRTAQLGIWREGRSQTLSVTLGNRRDQLEPSVKLFGPRDFQFEFPMPNMMVMERTPLLGVNAEDLSGQLGNYFGAPGGEGILIREVNPSSPAEKAGMKAGDVITKVDGERVGTLSELREKLRDKREQKSVSIGVIRKGSEVSLSVEIEQPVRPATPERRRIARRIAI